MDNSQNAGENIGTGENDKSGSDTDSVITPTNSPIKKPARTTIKQSGSSFGLHSPDNIPSNMIGQNNNYQVGRNMEVMKKYPKSRNQSSSS